ncbi:hypothetical protein BVG81_006340 [Haliangium sp. UPWRP_2]|nr:hypothetical protein BVG81_006340 [Haliangium sp. UPWRP_2]
MSIVDLLRLRAPNQTCCGPHRPRRSSVTAGRPLTPSSLPLGLLSTVLLGALSGHRESEDAGGDDDRKNPKAVQSGRASRAAFRGRKDPLEARRMADETGGSASTALVRSMSRRGNFRNNAVPESPIAPLKQESCRRLGFASREDARPAIFEYVEIFYNRQRLHSSCDYRSPIAYEAMHTQAALAA